MAYVDLIEFKGVVTSRPQKTIQQMPHQIKPKKPNWTLFLFALAIMLVLAILLKVVRR